MITDVEHVIREYLPQVIHLSLATCVNNKPWVCEVHYVYDDDLNLYFRSKTEKRHSKEIAINNSVAGNIVRQHGKEDRPRGVYFERFGTDAEILEEAKRDDGHKFYKITVETFYVFDSIESKPSQKYELAWGK
jgi:uncharacterized protein YhbP (UPF0306 family)